MLSTSPKKPCTELHLEKPINGLLYTTSQSIDDILDSKKSLSHSLKKQSKIILPEHLKESVLSRIKRNYPGLEMFTTLKNEATFTSYIFTGIKSMNDNKALGPAFVDATLTSFKEKFTTYCHESGIECQAVWDDYKNFVVTPASHGLNQEVIEELLQEALSEKLSGIDIHQTRNQGLGVTGMSGIIEGELTEKENIITSLARVRMTLEQEYSNTTTGFLEFFGKNGKSGEELLIDALSILEDETVEIESEDGKSTYSIVDGKYNITSFENGNSSFDIYAGEGKSISPKLISAFYNGEIPKNTKLHTVLSETLYIKEINSIVEEKGENKEGVIYSIHKEGGNENNSGAFAGILEIDNNKGDPERIQIFNDDGFFMTSIITMVRKKQIPESMALYKKVRKVLDMLIADGEFIFPYWESKGGLNQNEYSELKNKIANNEEIDLDVLEKGCRGYYKGGLSKDDFVDHISQKKGQLFFVDIKDMGSINMKDFYCTLQQVIRGEISKDDAILGSGSLMTQKFIAIIDEIESKFGKGNIDFTIGGDEISLFVEGAKSSKQSIFIINKAIVDQNIFGRITTSVYDGTTGENNSTVLQNKLDKNTEYSKNLEKLLGTIERRLIEQKRSLGVEYAQAEKNINKILEYPETSKSLKFVAFQLLRTNLNEVKRSIEKRDKLLNKMYNFHIELDPSGDHSKDTIHFARKSGSYLLTEVFNINSGELLPGSPFIKLLEKQGLGRNKKSSD